MITDNYLSFFDSQVKVGFWKQVITREPSACLMRWGQGWPALSTFLEQPQLDQMTSYQNAARQINETQDTIGSVHKPSFKKMSGYFLFNCHV